MNIIYKLTVSFLSLSTILVCVWCLVNMNRVEKLVDSHLPGTLVLDDSQTIDDAEWWSFGPRLEEFWRALLLTSVILTLVSAILNMVGVFFDQYYLLLVFNSVLYIESVLAMGSQYLTLPGHLAWAIMFGSATVGHVYGHFLRKELIEQFVDEVYKDNPY